MSPVTVLIAVSEPLQRALLVRALGRTDHLVVAGSAHDGGLALEAILRGTPDVALVDTGLSTVDGLEICHRLAQARPDVGTRVLLLDGDPPVTRESAVACGAAGCLPVTATAAELRAAIASIANGGTIFHN